MIIPRKIEGEPDRQAAPSQPHTMDAFALRCKATVYVLSKQVVNFTKHFFGNDYKIPFSYFLKVNSFSFKKETCMYLPN